LATDINNAAYWYVYDNPLVQTDATTPFTTIHLTGEAQFEYFSVTVGVGDETLVHVSVTGHAATGNAADFASGIDTLIGQNGDDDLYGLDGNDVLEGGAGDEVMMF